MDHESKCGWSEYIEDVITSNLRKIFREYETEFIDYLRTERGMFVSHVRPGMKRMNK
jgi:hypothetical protein